MSDLEVHALTVSLFQSNCFFLGKAGQREVIVVDPGDNAGEILAAIKRENRQPVLYLLTHGHVDHVYALSEVVSALPAPVAMHPADAAWAFTDRAAFPPYYGPPAPPPQGITRDLADGQVWTDV
ncbi:MAG: MBL fold metallo-hydrolase, partial [Kiritimatiellae bacterium]|nr:MBL fold metallo-hydrolase [Kiritimatiellia bacterium]